MNNKLFGVTVTILFIGLSLYFMPFSEQRAIENKNTDNPITQSTLVTYKNTSANKVVNEIASAEYQQTEECEKDKVDQNLAQMVRHFAIARPAVKTTDNNLPMAKVYEALVGRNVYNTEKVIVPDKTIEQLAFKSNVSPVLDKEFLENITNKQLDYALNHLTTISQNKRVNYIAMALMRAPFIDSNYLYELNSLSERVTISDAISVTSHVLEPRVLAQILNRTEFNVNGIWYNFDKLMTMLLLAIENNNDVAVDYWLNRGAMTKIDGISLKPFLRLKRPKSEQAYVAAANIVTIIAKHVDSISGDEYRFLKTWLNMDILALVKQKVPENELGLPKELAEVRAHPLVVELNEQLQLLAKQNPDCFIDHIIASEKSELLEVLFMDDKVALEKSLDKALQFREGLKQHQDFVDRLFVLANEQKWQEALIFTLDEYQRTNNVEMLNFLLERFWAFNVSIDMITQLVEAGAEFKDSAVLELVFLKRKQQIITYSQFGLDITYVNEDGYNALHIAIIKEADIELIKFLYEQGVSLNRDKRGYTPIDYAKKNNDGSGYMQLVIDYFQSTAIGV